MMLEGEVSKIDQVGRLPRAEAWQNQLHDAARRLRRWAPSADTLGLWVRDYVSVRRSLNELNSTLEHVSWVLGWEASADFMEQGAMNRAVDHAVTRIGELARDIDNELRRSALDVRECTDRLLSVFSAA